MTEHEKKIIRLAMLEAESDFLTEAEVAETPTLRTLAVVMADAFGKRAERYKTKETSDRDAPLWNDDEFGTASALPA